VRSSADLEERLISDGYHPSEVALIARTNTLLIARTNTLLDDRARHAIAAANLHCHPLANDDEPPINRGAIGTMHHSRGLHSPAVAVLGAEDGELSSARVLDKQADTPPAKPSSNSNATTATSPAHGRASDSQ